MFTPLTPHEFWSIQEDVTNISFHYIANDFANWIVYKHYPIVTQESSCCLNLTQYFSRIRYGKWWISTSLIIKSSMSSNIQMTLTPQKPSSYLGRITKDNWIMVNIKQAGKHLSIRKLIIHIYDYFPTLNISYYIFLIIFIYINFQDISCI